MPLHDARIVMASTEHEFQIQLPWWMHIHFLSKRSTSPCTIVIMGMSLNNKELYENVITNITSHLEILWKRGKYNCYLTACLTRLKGSKIKIRLIWESSKRNIKLKSWITVSLNRNRHCHYDRITKLFLLFAKSKLRVNGESLSHHITAHE